MKRLGVDVGGTFTDLIYVDDEAGTVLVHKLPSSPDDPSVATVQGIQELTARAGISPADLDQVFHGTTIATNIVIEHNGAKVGMITTEGYRDILHIARHKKPFNFSNYQDLPWQAFPVVRRRYRLTVPERITGDGKVLVPLDEAKAREQVRKLKAEGVEAVAICFLFSFINNAHEAKVAEIVREEFPEAFISVSSEVIPQYREYERFSTVGLNAFVGPKVSRYIRRLEDSLRALGVRTGVHLMTSSAGVATAEGAIERPVNLLMSGPVAGVVGGIWAGKQAGFNNVITLDVGGTSADVGLAQDGRLRMKHLLDTKVGPYSAMIPMVDVDTIGAGGGSIAYVDGGGMFRVGPRSAGAVPGPAAYGRGGTEATSTDAMVNLGWLSSEGVLGGGMKLDADAARVAFADGPAKALGMSVEEASYGAIQILTHSMTQAIEENSVRKGFDPREFALVAFGGAGALHGADVARELSIPTVLVPPNPGITAALGCLLVDVKHDLSEMYLANVADADPVKIEQEFVRLEAEAQTLLADEGVPPEQREVERSIDMRYLGQWRSLGVAVGSPVDVEAAVARFHAEHEREYSYRRDGAAIEIYRLNVKALGVTPKPEFQKHAKTGVAPVPRTTRPAWFDGDGPVLDTPVFDRSTIAAGSVIHGPAIFEQLDSTVVVPPGWRAEVDEWLNIRMHDEEAGK